jgi:hydrogenase nickel incorporation protein HypA/HybF
MHEVGIMRSAINIAEQEARAAGATKIHEIRLRIGQMSGVVPEALEHAFTVLKDGTMAEEGRLVVDFVPAVCWCSVCQREFESSTILCVCPDCKVPSGDIRKGRELEIVSLEVDD